MEFVTSPLKSDPPADALARCEGMLAWRPFPGLATRAPRLRWIQSLTGGCEHWLASPDLSASVTLTCARGTHRLQMPEHILAALFMITKQIPGIVLDQRERRWRRRVNPTLGGTTLGILGIGAIGAEVARKASALEMRVIGTKRQPGPVAGVARGDLVVDADLVDAVKKRVIAGAVLDVFRKEPLPEEHPFWTTEGIVVLPHVGGLHPERDVFVAELFVENLRRFVAGRPLTQVVDRALGY